MSKKAIAGDGPATKLETASEEDALKHILLKDLVANIVRELPQPQKLNEQPLPAAKIELPGEALAPQATEAILNAQLLECVALVRDAGWLYRNSPLHPDDRGSFTHQAINLMRASGDLAKAIALLRGEKDVPTTRQHYVVQHVNDPGVGGLPESKNE